MDVSDKVCRLECLKDANIHEFVGPVKIILVDPPKREYDKKKKLSAFIAVATMMQGAVVMFIIVLTLTFFLPFYSNLHVYLCTIGYQLFMPSAILMVNGMFGPATSLKKTDRICQHIFLQVFGMLCFLSGSYMAHFSEEKFKDRKNTKHYYAGCAAGVFSILASMMGPILVILKKERDNPSFLTKIHRLFGILAFLSASVCFIISLLYPLNIYWMLGMGVPMILILFCLFYTIVILYTPVTNMWPAKKII